MGMAWSVSWQFKEKWVIAIDGTLQQTNERWKTVEKINQLNISEFENYIMDLHILDFETEGNNVIIYTDKTKFDEVKKQLETDKYHILEADLQYIPENMISLPTEEKNQFLWLIDALDEDEDVDNVRHNISF